MVLAYFDPLNFGAGAFQGEPIFNPEAITYLRYPNLSGRLW
jgi:hypothetical protein